MPGLQDLPGVFTHKFLVPVPMAAAGTDDEYPVGPFPKCTITGVKWVPLASVTANGTNFSTLSLRNRGAADAGTALPATRSYIATNSAARVAEAMALSATAADLLVAANDILTVQRLHTASGVVIPAGVVEISYTLR